MRSPSVLAPTSHATRGCREALGSRRPLILIALPFARRWTDQRQYDFRCDERQELTVWKEACEKAIAKHWYA